MTPQDSPEARIAETAKQLEWESTAANSAASFVGRYADECCRHTEAVADCAHCNLRFLASYARRSGALMADVEYLLGRLHEQAQEIRRLEHEAEGTARANNDRIFALLSRAEAAESALAAAKQEIAQLNACPSLLCPYEKRVRELEQQIAELTQGHASPSQDKGVVTEAWEKHKHEDPGTNFYRVPIEYWKAAAFLKIRTRLAIYERVKAGDDVKQIAEEYGVPLEWVDRVTTLGYDMWVEDELRSQHESETRVVLAEPQDGVSLIAAERWRQVELEGWTAKHDDSHTDGSLACAGACLAVEGTAGEFTWPCYDSSWIRATRDAHASDDRVRQLSIAGALIAAEIDRLLRKAAQK